MKLILRYLKKHLGIFLLSTCFLTMEAVCDLLQPTMMASIVDNGVAQADVGQILRCGAIMLGIALLGAGAAVMRNLFASRTSQTVAMELRGDLYHKVQTLSMENLDRLQPASVITRITNDVTQIQEFINSSMRMMVKAPITCIGAIILIVLKTPRQSPVLICIVLVMGLLIFGNLKIGYPRFGRVQKAMDLLNNVSREFLSAIRVVKAFCAEERETDKMEGASRNLSEAGISAMRMMAVFSPLINLTVNFGIVVLLWSAGRPGTVRIGSLMASVNYMTQVLFAFSMISNIMNTAVRAMASSDRIAEVLEETPAQTQAVKPQRPVLRGAVEFRDVSFSYAGAGRESLHGVSFCAEPGQTIGIIGPTGAGKSTLANLVPRFYDATEGTVFVDGCDVRQLEEAALRDAVAVVPQKALLFTGTIRENLCWGRENAGEDALREAVATACADSVLNAVSDGYETMLSQGGVNLSGGQKQRLSLARALLRDPAILILDDCTSALDAETEANVLSHLRQSTKRRTVLLISQKIATVRGADRILCLQDGCVQGFGTHETLLQTCPAYRAIYDSQIGGDEDVG